METLEAVQSDYELERGKPMPSWNHGLIQARIIFELSLNYRHTHTILSELSLQLNLAERRTVPDITVYAELLPYLTADEVTVQRIPITTIEILSPTQGLAELTDKMEGYLAAGVKSCWLVLPGLRTVAVSTVPGEYRSFDHHAKLVDPATGIELELSALFK